MVSAKDVTVVIPVGAGHEHVWQRTKESVQTENAGDIQILADLDGYGVCYARNEAILRARTALVLPLDADDYLLPGAVERMAAAWSEHKVVYGGWRVDDTDFQASPPDMLNRKHVCHATYLFAKEDWRRVGGYDPDFNIGAEDWAFMIALVNAGCELVRLDGDPLYVKTLSDNGRTYKAIRHKHMIQELLREKYPDFFRTP